MTNKVESDNGRIKLM